MKESCPSCHKQKELSAEMKVYSPGEGIIFVACCQDCAKLGKQTAYDLSSEQAEQEVTE